MASVVILVENVDSLLVFRILTNKNIMDEREVLSRPVLLYFRHNTGEIVEF